MSRQNKQSVVSQLHSKGLIKPPDFVMGGAQYEVIMGSIAYGVSNDNSDMDIYGFCMPPKAMIFPHLNGEIEGFGRQKKRFEQFDQKKIIDKSTGKEYDFSIYNIVKFFMLAMENNPNMVDALFVPENCVVFKTKIADMVRDERKSFLHKGCWHRFKGYAFQQMHKMKIKNPKPGSKRWESVQEFGYDVKFAYHVVRLLDEVEQILTLHDLDLQRAKEHMKAIRKGEVSQKDVEEFFYSKEKALEKIYEESKLPYSPDEEKIKTLLLNCLEEYYGNLDNCIIRPDQAMVAIEQIKEVIAKNNL